LRLHGRDAKAYLTGKTVAAHFDYDYSTEEIDEVAERSRKLAREAKKCMSYSTITISITPRAGCDSVEESPRPSCAEPSPQTPELF
jgi:hypothetical protein